MPNILSYKYVMVPVLANAALLKAAPGIGDLHAYIKEVTDMLEANDIPVPNFVQESTLLSSSIKSMKNEQCLDNSHGTLDFQEDRSDASLIVPTELDTTDLSCLYYSDCSKMYFCWFGHNLPLHRYM